MVTNVCNIYIATFDSFNVIGAGLQKFCKQGNYVQIIIIALFFCELDFFNAHTFDEFFDIFINIVYSQTSHSYQFDKQQSNQFHIDFLTVSEWIRAPEKDFIQHRFWNKDHSFSNFIQAVTIFLLEINGIINE